jgi:hypothetical protein
MTSMRRACGGLAAALTLVGLAACSTPPSDGSKVASSLPPDCPVGTHICRRGAASANSQSVDRDTMRNQGVTGFGTPQAGPAIRNSAGS